MATAEKIKDQKEHIIQRGYLAVGQGHELYYEVFGNPQGIPVLFLHGGPGAGFLESDKRFFDPKIFKVIFFDQRGAARSRPPGSLDSNETSFLIEDIISLLDYLATEKVLIFGGSWGSTLALLFAIAYPHKVISMLLRGVFLANQASIHHLTQGGVSTYYPQEWGRLERQVPDAQKGNIVQYYADQIQSEDVSQSDHYAYEWVHYDLSIYKKSMDPDTIKEAIATYPFKSMARLETYYLSNACFIEEDYILQNVEKIKTIPTVIVHGRFDVICPPLYAYQLHQKLEHSQLHFVDAGHAESEPAIEEQLRRSLEEMVRKLRDIRINHEDQPSV